VAFVQVVFMVHAITVTRKLFKCLCAVLRMPSACSSYRVVVRVVNLAVSRDDVRWCLTLLYISCFTLTNGSIDMTKDNFSCFAFSSSHRLFCSSSDALF
jgi:hypothetical protein